MLELREPIRKKLESLGMDSAKAYWEADRFCREAHQCPSEEVERAVDAAIGKGITNLNYSLAILRRKGYLKPEKVRSRGVDELDDPFA